MIELKHYQGKSRWNCFPAGVKILLSHFGDDHDEAAIADLLDTSPDRGTNRWNVEKLARWGYEVTAGFGTVRYLESALEADHPVLLTVILPKFNNRTHTVVLAGLDETHAHIYDPAQPTGPCAIKRSDLLGCWQRQGRFCAVVRRDPDFAAFIYDTDGNPQEVYSLSPERQNHFGKIEKVSGILLTGNTVAAAQPEANTLSGLYRAWKNIRFAHILVRAKNMRFLEPATLDYFGVTLEEGDTVRGYDWPGKEFLCLEVSYELDNAKGIILVDVTGEASTWGPDGVAGDYPSTIPGDIDPPPDYIADWPADPPPWGADAIDSSDDWEPAAGAWVNDGGPGGVWKFFIYDDRLFAVAETGDANRGLWERTAPATWVHRGVGGAGEYDAWTWTGRVWIVNVADNSIYRTMTPENAASWVLDFTPPGAEAFDIKGCAADYGGWLYVATVDPALPDVVHFHRRGAAWTLDYLPAYTNPNPWPNSMDAYDFVKYGFFWWSGYEQGTGYIFKKSTGGAFSDYTTNLQAGKFENCHAMYFTSAILDKVYRGTGGGWVEDYDFDGDSINYIDLSVDWTGDVVWAGSEIDAANIQCHAKWWGEDWRSILPSCADTWGGGAIRGPDDHAYLGGSANIWRFVPA